MQEIDDRCDGAREEPGDDSARHARAAGIEPGTTFDIQYVNGVITMTLSEHRKPGDSLEQYAGVGRGLWGHTASDVAESLERDRATWER